MKNLFILGFNFLFFYVCFAQKHEIGVGIGSSNIVGDIGKTKYIQFIGSTNSPALSIGAFYKRNFNPYQGIKFKLSYSSVYFDDNTAKETYRKDRKISRTNNILDANIIFEYNFFPINNESKKLTWSPYVFGGISSLLYSIPTTEYIINQKDKQYTITENNQGYQKKITGGIPFGIGLKFKFNYNWSIFGELTFRPTFTDDLDYNDIERTNYFATYKDIPETNIDMAVESFNEFIKENKVGNLHSKDWFNSIHFGVSYSFGRPPCQCD